MDREGTTLASGRSDNALVVSTMYTEAELPDQIGREAYSYRFVQRAFTSLLERWGKVTEINRAESRLPSDRQRPVRAKRQRADFG